MPRYTFRCESPVHAEEQHGARSFECVIQHREGKRIDQSRCPCGGIAKRDFLADAATVGVVGMVPIRPNDSKFAIGRELEYSFGRFKRDPDGKEDKNHSPFRDTGEMSRFMAGANDLGNPKLDEYGLPIRRRDGSVVRDGAKLFKYGSNATPSIDRVRKGKFRPPASIVPSFGWGREESVGRESAGAVSYPDFKAPRHRNPERRS